jgi:acyl-CoA thioester hydrolase
VKVRARADGSADFLQLSLQRPAKAAEALALGWPAMPERFRHRLRVRFNECDPQGVVFYANYLMYVDVAMTEFWREAFGGYKTMVESGTDVMVAEATLRYRDSARFDDDLDLSLWVRTLGSSSVVTPFRLERVADAALLVEGELRHVFVEATSYEKRSIPARVREGLERHLVEEPEQVTG